MLARGGPNREANQDARSARRRGEDRREAIRVNRTADTRIFSLTVRAPKQFAMGYPGVRCEFALLCGTLRGSFMQNLSGSRNWFSNVFRQARPAITIPYRPRAADGAVENGHRHDRTLPGNDALWCIPSDVDIQRHLAGLPGGRSRSEIRHSD